MAAALKHYLNERALQRIALVLTAIKPQFAGQLFISQALIGLEPLELKQRVAHIISVLAQHLADDFSEAALLLQQLPEAG